MTEAAEAKSLGVMTVEVQDWCLEKGWYDAPVSFGEAMALLHSEVAEASDAWRRWGLADATPHFGEASLDTNPGAPAVSATAKPEGVGSEFADIFIRMLDDAARFKVRLRTVPGVYGISESFLENMNTLHTLIARVSEINAAGDSAWRAAFQEVLAFLHQCCEKYGIDLHAEYERKMAYNRTRPYRHGGKRQ
jgi:hypothetical protein